MQQVTLAEGESVRIGSLIQLTMVGAEEGKTTLAVDAPEGVEIAKDGRTPHGNARPPKGRGSVGSNGQSAAAFADEGLEAGGGRRLRRGLCQHPGNRARGPNPNLVGIRGWPDRLGRHGKLRSYWDRKNACQTSSRT